MLEELITVVIPTSPIPSHPTTTLIEQTIKSIRAHLPRCPILVTADGVRPEQEKFKPRYLEYLSRLEVLATKHDARVMMHLNFCHQAAMMRQDLPFVMTPLLFYCEHDLPLLPDPIDFDGIAQVLLSGDMNLIRLHYWSQILDDHKHLMLDEKPVFFHGVPLVRTIQYSQHPHVARVDFYARLLSNYSPECRTMIETRAYPLVVNAPWEEWKCAIYAPEPNLRRIHHLHGREEESKFEDTFIF